MPNGSANRRDFVMTTIGALRAHAQDINVVTDHIERFILPSTSHIPSEVSASLSRWVRGALDLYERGQFDMTELVQRILDLADMAASDPAGLGQRLHEDEI